MGVVCCTPTWFEQKPAATVAHSGALWTPLVPFLEEVGHLECFGLLLSGLQGRQGKVIKFEGSILQLPNFISKIPQKHFCRFRCLWATKHGNYYRLFYWVTE